MEKNIKNIASIIQGRISYRESSKSGKLFSSYVTESFSEGRKGLVYKCKNNNSYINIDVSWLGEEYTSTWYTAMLGFAAGKYFECDEMGERIS